ncbi:hypothetical protein ACFXNW_03055 [Nocardia sp. NPDC059180]|uniref:hypothetical protein n=1 Tax=Nocardia sp. NPDC059180 TaxID=3346761 RepID=UPI0036B7FB09
MTVTLTAQDQATLRIAAYGAVSLMAAADVAGKPHKAATGGSYALHSATGLVGHVLAAKSNDIKLTGKTTAELADQVLPALAATISLLEQQDQAEADNFRSAVLVAIDAAARAHKGLVSPTSAEMARKITVALDTTGVAAAV